MRNNRNSGIWVGLLALSGFVWAASNALADTEINMDDLSTPSSFSSSQSTPVPASSPKPKASPVPKSAPEPAAVKTPDTSLIDLTPTPGNDADQTATGPTATPTPLVVQGVLKMKDIYQAGMKYYKEQDFDQAIRYLKRAIAKEDPHTPKFYYAEADAILGVIYQFHIIDKKLARHYYQAALDIDPTTETAKKHIGEVSDSDDTSQDEKDTN